MFLKHSEALRKGGYTIEGDKIANQRGDVVALLDQYGDLHTKDDLIVAILSSPVPAEEPHIVEEKSKARKRDKKAY